MLGPERTGRILAAHSEDAVGTTRVAVDPRGEVVDLPADGSPAGRGAGVLLDLGDRNGPCRRRCRARGLLAGAQSADRKRLRVWFGSPCVPCWPANAAVPSMPHIALMTAWPPSCLGIHAVRLYTVPATTLQQSAGVACAFTCSSV